MPSSADRVPERFKACTLVGYNARVSDSAAKALVQARHLANGDIRALVLLGRAGVGKTHLLAAVWSELYNRVEATYRAEEAEWDAAVRRDPIGQRWTRPLPERGPRPAWCNVPELVSDLRFEMGMPAHEQTAAPRARRLREHPGLVVLDDLGREKITDWTGELVYTLVNGRYERKLATAVTSNLTIAELRDSGYYPAISRLAEDGAIVEITAPDHRLTRAAAA